MARDWSQLQTDLLTLIGEKLNKLNDLYCFLSVCTSWRAANIQFPQSPWLIFFDSEIETRTNRRQKNENPPLCGLVGLGEQNVRELDLPKPDTIQCVGSAGNFLILQEGEFSYKFSLFNPLFGVSIQLPPIKSLAFFGKLATRNTNEVVMAFVDKLPSVLVIARPGDTNWTIVIKYFELHDLILYKNRFLTVSHSGEVTAWDVGHSSKIPIKGVKLSSVFSDSFETQRNYLVEWLGELLLIKKYPMHKNRKCRFKVYQLKWKNMKWYELTNLRNYSLFLGKNASVSVLASGSIKGNCIYYTDDCDRVTGKSRGHDMGVFSLEGNGIEPHYIESVPTNHHSLPVWLVPSSNKSESVPTNHHSLPVCIVPSSNKSEAGVRKRKRCSILP